MTDISKLAQYPSPSYQSLQASSYNRRSTSRFQKNQSSTGWFADSDGVGFIRKVSIKGREEWLAMEHDGPGCLTHLWTPYFYYNFNNRIGPNIRIYLDGSGTPVIDENFIELLTNNMWPEHFGDAPDQKNDWRIPAPFARFTARAGNLYLPIPFAKSCRVTFSSKPFYNIINYRAYPDGTSVETFTRDVYVANKRQVQACAKSLNSLPKPMGNKAQRSVELDSKDEIVIDLPSGSNALRELRFSFRPEDFEANPGFLRNVLFELSSDGQSTVWCPMGDFFGCANRLNPYQTKYRTVSKNGDLICHWVMPYEKHAKLTIKNLHAEPIRFQLAATTTPWKWSPHSMHFHATWVPDKVYSGDRFHDLKFLDAEGSGVLVGDQWTVLNPTEGWWGEGDEKIYVDGAYETGFPSHFGTGTEDYYGWAGGVNPDEHDIFSHPFLANIQVGDPNNKKRSPRGINICNRVRALDAVPFAQRLRFDMEASPGVGQRKSTDLLGYSSVTFWYGKPGARSAEPRDISTLRAPMMNLQNLQVRSNKTASPAVKRIRGAIEFENITPAEYSPGLRFHSQKPAPKFNPNKTWSNGRHLFVHAAQIGDSISFKIQPATFDKQVIHLYMTHSYDFSVVRVFVNGNIALAEYDLFSPNAKVKSLHLGSFKPQNGSFDIRFEIIRKNKRSKGKQYLLGLDALTLESVGADRS